VSSSSLVPVVLFVQAHTASSLHVSADPVEEKKSAEDPSRISELSTSSTLERKSAEDVVYWWRKEVSKLQEKKDQPIVCNQNWEKDCWRIEAELWGKIFDVYPLVTKEQRQKHREIWGEMIENKKRESKRELRNLQSFENYGDIKASLRHRRDKANRS
jgi:galactose-1-phosphate uridylyltransferase